MVNGTRMLQLKRIALFSAVFVVIATLPNRSALSAAIEWGNVGSTFSTGANWVGGTAPANSTVTDIGSFGSTGASAVHPSLTAGRSINGITFLSGAFSYTFGATGGSTLLIGTGGIVDSAANTETFGSTFTIATSATQSWTSNGGSKLVFDGVVDINNNAATARVLTLNGAGDFTFSGTSVIKNSNAGSTGSLTYSGSGTLTLAGANTYTGNTTISGGGTTLVSNTAGSGTGTGNVTVNGSGTTLGGTGTISGTVTLGNTTAGAILNPGPKGTAGTSASVGTLTTGAVTLTGANTVHIDAFGTATTAWDKLVSTGAISLGTTSTLDVTIASGLTFNPGDTYVLLSGTSLSGTFSGIADNQTVTFSGYTFTADYTTTGFDLVAVPEPSTWIGGALALLAVGLMSRKRFIKTAETLKA